MPTWLLLSIKEIVSVLQIITAVLCIVSLVLLTIAVRFPSNYKLVAYQCALSSTAILFLIFAFSTWFYNSNYSKTRLHVTCFRLLIMWLFCIAILLTGIPVMQQYSGEYIFGYFEKEIYDEKELLLIDIGCYMGIAIAALMLIINLLLTFLLVHKLKNRNTSAPAST